MREHANYSANIDVCASRAASFAGRVFLVPPAGIEPATFGLQILCQSTPKGNGI